MQTRKVFSSQFSHLHLLSESFETCFQACDIAVSFKFGSLGCSHLLILAASDDAITLEMLLCMCCGAAKGK